MGVNFKDIIAKKEVSFDQLSKKTFAVDSFNVLYQFVSTIRQRDGSLLTDSQGNITSHLSGLFYRTTKLMSHNLKLSFVFDGEAPELKKKERQRRHQLKENAQKKYEDAKSKGDIEGMKKFASRTSKLSREMVGEAKELLSALGVPIIQAPSEGEAQAAKMVESGDIDYAISQDFDSLLFGVPNMVRNLTISERKKLMGRVSYETIKPETINLSENLNALGIDRDQLIALGMLVGTDFNIGGIKGIGPKNAIKLVKQHGSDLDTLFKETKWDDHFDFPWTEVFYLFKKMPTTQDYNLTWKPFDRDKVFEILCDRHDFSKPRIDSSLKRLEKELLKSAQKGLGDFF
ncbi:flap endonuclease-1 [Candidatus Woesearchaeota archaeon]|jgi:flap endonuclease-1|nr:flap endonuclease-1 [Candidatus Woesearchaeota archaeon]MBT6520243.1 flap endonuclease-1 [Candidatus Woesearchaeota archaeon]MBT7367254.1 flap endonuclease-1 [Candidatus Woesearchaeota archaeon]